MFRKENGVTLVALVITIIVLLILAGVTITMALDDDGIIAQAKNAEDSQAAGVAEDNAVSAMAAAFVRKTAVTADKNTAIGALLVDEIEQMGYTAGTVTEPTADDDGSVEITKDSITYTVTFTPSSIVDVVVND